jgi:hypothetical protein
MANVLSALAALLEIINLLKGVVLLYRDAKREGWLEEGRELAKAINGAKTNDERKELVRKLADYRKSLP